LIVYQQQAFSFDSLRYRGNSIRNAPGTFSHMPGRPRHEMSCQADENDRFPDSKPLV
jgi:hypothetical protein